MIRVLLVEDDPVIRDTTCYFLKSQQNFEVVCAETGGDALSHAREKFDVILMDILLPDTNGVDPVSYTHLDVYKRQLPAPPLPPRRRAKTPSAMRC